MGDLGKCVGSALVDIPTQRLPNWALTVALGGANA